MDERNDEANVPRAPWRRLLEDRADAPPDTTDARIRAAARRALEPHRQRWWLPTSLAASFVLAVLIVRSQIGTGDRIPIAPTGRGEGAASDARAIPRRDGEPAREPAPSPAAPSPALSKQPGAAQSDAYDVAESGLSEEAASTTPMVGGPERELKAASEMPDESIPFDAPAPASAGTASRVQSTPGSAALANSLPEPEAWYSAIEELRREGRTAEADREIERLRKAYPGWLEKRLGSEKPP